MRATRILSLLFVLSLLLACGGDAEPTGDPVATQIAIELAAHATMTASAPTATATSQVEAEKTVQAAIAATTTASVPTSTPTPEPPRLKPLSEISETDLYKALLAPKDITFEGQYSAEIWQGRKAGNASVAGNPAVAGLVKSWASVCWTGPQEQGEPKVCDWLYITESNRQAERLAAVLKQDAEGVMAIIFGNVSTTSLELGAQSIQVIEAGGYTGLSGGIVLVVAEESVREIRVFFIPLVTDDLTDLAAAAWDKLTVVREQ